MDQTRRQASGTLAELLGAAAIPSDVQLRTLGLRRAAVKSMAVLSAGAIADLEAYAAGVNAWLSSHALPPEYAALELSSIPPWTALDSIATAKLLTFGLSFDTSDIQTTQRLVAYQTALGPVAGAALFAEDVMRIEPFAHAPSIRPGETSGPVRTRPAGVVELLPPAGDARAGGRGQAQARRGRDRRRRRHGLERLGRLRLEVGHGAADGRQRPTPRAPVAVDLLRGRDPREDLVLYGVTFPGLPSVVHGMNEHVAWGSTVNPTDVTDVYQESVVLAGGVPVATMFRGAAVPTQIFPQSYRANQRERRFRRPRRSRPRRACRPSPSRRGTGR